MSGPKVVRIITREEVIALCVGLLAQLREANAQWTKTGKRNDLVTDDEMKTTAQRVSQVEALLSKDRFQDIQKQVPKEIAFLKADMTRRLQDVAKKAADARTRSRRLSATAVQLLVRLEDSSAIVPAELRGQLQALADNCALDPSHAERMLNEALALTVMRRGEDRLTEHQVERARRLGGDASSQSLDD